MYLARSGFGELRRRRVTKLISAAASPATPPAAGRRVFVGGEEVLDAGAVGGEGLAAVEFVDGGIEFAVGAAQIGGHEIGIVEIGQRRTAMRRARIEHGLAERADFVLGFLICLGPMPTDRSPSKP
jgi:hypothetical protein